MEPLPRFWASHRELVECRDQDYELTLWGWSHRSMAEALEVARRRVADFRSRDGRQSAVDYYPLTPLREETLHELYADDGRLLAVITRNRSGVEVLNTDAMLIADVDIHEDPRPQGWLARLRRRPPEGPSAEDRARDTIARFAQANPGLGVQVHRTAGGFRVFVTGTDAAPGSATATAILESLDADRLYGRLCGTHRTYRARLTPKPWRMGKRGLRQPWPHADTAAELATRAWVAAYEQQLQAYATCRREATYGPSPTPQEAQILALHHERTRADSTLPLA